MESNVFCYFAVTLVGLACLFFNKTNKSSVLANVKALSHRKKW